MKVLLVLALAIAVSGCGSLRTKAVRSDDDKTITIYGAGSVKWEDGTTIKRPKIWTMPDLPPITYETDK